MSRLINTEYRIESKYISKNPTALSEFEILIKNNGFLHFYNSRSVYSLYYDDIFLSSVNDNLAGISNRSKFRLRSYFEDDKSFYGWQFERKIKRGSLGTKKIILLPKDFDYKKFNFSVNSLFKLTKNKTLNCLLNLEPIIVVNYSREYYQDSKGNRITIDNNLKFNNFRDFNSFSNVEGWASSNLSIVEIKFNSENKYDLLNIFREIKFTQTRCSKYLLGLSILRGYSYI